MQPTFFAESTAHFPAAISRGSIAFLVILGIIFVVFAAIAVIMHSRRLRAALWFKSPFPESGGKRSLSGLSPVEAGIVMSVDIPRLLAMYLLDLVACGDVGIVSNVPLKVEILNRSGDPEFRQRFLDAVREDGTLDADRMLSALDWLYNSVGQRIRNHRVRETVMHYLDRVDDLWETMEGHLPVTAKLETLRRAFPWLLLHENAADRLEYEFSNTTKRDNVQPIVKMLRLVKDDIVTDLDLLKHAASHPAGVFSNPKYREDAADWARSRVESAAWGSDEGSLHQSPDGFEEVGNDLRNIRNLLDAVEER
jgi:hypothetical protein